VFETRSRARATIALQTIKKIEPIKFTYSSAGSHGVIAQPVGTVLGSAYSIQASAGANGGSGSGIYSIGQIHAPHPPHVITVHSADGKPVLVITRDGDVEWHGKPSEAAKVMVRSLQVKVEESKGVDKAARRRYYYLACRNLLSKAKQMDQEKFIDYLEKQVYNREIKIMWDALSNEQN